MPRSNAPNPYALLDSVIRELGKEHIRKYLDHAVPTAEASAPPVVRKRKKRADAGKPRGQRAKTLAATAARAKAPISKALAPAARRVKKAKPRVDPLNTVTDLSTEV